MRHVSTTRIIFFLGTCVFTVFLAGHAVVAGPADGEDPATESQRLVDYSIIVTGNELLSGVYADSHTLFLTKTLRPLGLHCVGSLSVDDRAEDILRALEFTLPRSQLVIVTGGLGPTDSDITRDVLSKFTHIPLREDPEALQEMERRFHTSRDHLRRNLRRQTEVPVQGTYLPNASGTAVGLVFEHGEKVIVALPGPPRELHQMVREHLIDYLAKKFGVRTLGSTITVRFVGLGQSQIDQTMEDHIELPDDVMQTSQFEAGRVDFTFSLPGDRDEDHRRLEQLRAELHKYLGDHIYADDPNTTLEGAAIRSLTADGQTVVLTEVATGGTLAAGFARTPGGSQVLAGDFVATDLRQLRRILRITDEDQSAKTVTVQLREIAAVAREQVGSEWALVVGPPESAGKRSLVQVLIRDPEGQLVQQTFPWRGSSHEGLARLTTHVFDLLRRVTSAR